MYGEVIYKDRFIWNRLKAEANRKRHSGMTFEMGGDAYDDPFAIDEYDEENSADEDRFNRTGIVEDRYITVTFTMRGSLARIISVREADAEEKEAYNEHVRKHFGIR
jgi:uncharacterized DUF497 family protein